MTPEELCNLLRQTLQPDTAVVAQAAEQLKVYFKQPESIENLFLIMKDNQDPVLR